MSRTRIILKSGKDQSLHRYHPWVFSGAIKKIAGPVTEGDLVDVEDNKGNFLGTGHYQPGSIAVRILSFEPVEPDEAFWRSRLAEALALRRELGLAGNEETNVYRLVFGEGDRLPGLIVDHYNGVLVMQFHSVGMYLLRETFAGILQELYDGRLETIYDKSGHTLPHKAAIQPGNGWLLGKAKETEVSEYGHRFLVNWVEGQKTGFFVDQRENRRLVGSLARDRHVLNLFGYTGGFSVYALQGGATLVHTVDSSAQAVKMARRNAELNTGKDKRHKGIVTDAFEWLDKAETEYDLIILDPPAFAKHQKVLHNALQGYKRLNEKAFRKIRPGGILATFSCSQVVSREQFRQSVFVAAANAGRHVRILYQLTQPPDHPVSLFHPEGEYLKGLVVKVE